MNRLSILYLVLVMFLSCDSNGSDFELDSPKKSTSKYESEIRSNLELSWDAPVLWEKYKSSSTMRLASYKVPYTDDYSSDYGDLSITVLNGFSGNLQANVNRWRRQLGLKPQPLDAIMSQAIIKNNDLGEYNIFKIINHDNIQSAFICAIMSTANSTIFIKLNIKPEKIIEVEESFIDFCQTFGAS